MEWKTVSDLGGSNREFLSSGLKLVEPEDQSNNTVIKNVIICKKI